MRRQLSIVLTLVLIAGVVSVVVAQNAQTPPPGAGTSPAAGVGTGPGGGITPPRVLFSPKPEYTREAMLARIQGQVIVRAVVQADGTVGEVTVTQSLEPSLDQEAIKAARQFRFAPATFNGTPVSVIVNMVLEFNIRNRNVSGPEWPTGFTSTGTRVPSLETTVTSDVTLSVGRLDDWSLAPTAGPGQLLVLRNNRGAILSVEQPVTIAPGVSSPAAAALAVMKTFTGERMPKANGQVSLQGRSWAWFEFDIDAGERPPAGVLDGATRFKGGRGWAFVAPIGTHAFVIACRAYGPENATPEETDAAISRLSADFGEMLRVVTISDASPPAAR
jgi:TonB family protein